ncbi:MAG: SPOR domain-containing protein [Xanthobacteraceae bacterium]
MADDRNRAPNIAISGNTARATARGTAAAQRSGSDPLVELARLIGQSEDSFVASAYETTRPAARRREQASSDAAIAEPRMAEPRGAGLRAPAPRRSEPPASPPYPQAPERRAGRGAESERYAEQRYDGYADPHATDPRDTQAPRTEPQTWRDTGPDLADPYHTEAGWRPPRKRTAARPETAARQTFAPQQDYDATEPPRSAGHPRMPQAAAPASAVQTEARRSAAPRVSPAAAAPAAAPRASVSPASLDDLRETYRRYAPAADGAYESGDYYDDHQRSAGGQAPYDRDAYGDEDVYNHGGVDYEEQADNGRRRKIALALALVALAVIGTGGAYAVRSMFAGSSPSGPPPIIHADTSPKKIAAANPGDKQLQDRVGDRSAAERMVSREEAPMAIRDPNAAALIPGVRSPAEPPVVSAPATTSAANSPLGTPDSGKPKRIRTVTIRPGNEPDDATPRERGVPAATPATARTVPPATPADAAPQAAPTPPPSPRARTATAAPPPRVSRGDYMVQLSAQKSEADARNSFRILQSKYSSVLGGQELYIKRKDLGRRGVYYGAQVGPFASRAEATQLCADLKAAGGNCIVQRD